MWGMDNDNYAIYSVADKQFCYNWSYWTASIIIKFSLELCGYNGIGIFCDYRKHAGMENFTKLPGLSNFIVEGTKDRDLIQLLSHINFEVII
jgi:hypothetical protein